MLLSLHPSIRLTTHYVSKMAFKSWRCLKFGTPGLSKKKFILFGLCHRGVRGVCEGSQDDGEGRERKRLEGEGPREVSVHTVVAQILL